MNQQAKVPAPVGARVETGAPTVAVVPEEGDGMVVKGPAMKVMRCDPTPHVF